MIFHIFFLFSHKVVSYSTTPWQHTRLPALHYLPEFAQTHAHWVSDAIQPSHPLSPPSSPAISLFQHQSLFPVRWLFTSGGKSVKASASVLPMNIQGWFSLGLTGLISLLPEGLSRVFSSTAVQKHVLTMDRGAWQATVHGLAKSQDMTEQLTL